MKTVLLVDDKIDIREILEDFLRNSGYETQALDNGDKAMQELAKNHEKYNLIVTDVIMPQKDGMTLLQELRELPGQDQNPTPVIMMTGGSTSIDLQNRLEEIAAQGNKILKKPFTKDQFITAVDKALNA